MVAAKDLRMSVFWREAGTGPAVVCLHANASTSGQWRGLTERLSPRWRVLAPDLIGAGQSPAWPHAQPVTLGDEARFIEPVLQRAEGPLVLVGHSYGAAVALIAALAQPARVRALVLYEPTLFALIEADGPSPNDADGIRAAVALAGAALDAGQPEQAAEIFIDYWTGPGSWAATPPARQPAIAAAVGSVRAWSRALFHEPTPLAALAALTTPVLCLTGQRSTAAAHGVTRRLLTVWPHAQHQVCEGLGHMGPVTHPAEVNARIDGFLATL